MVEYSVFSQNCGFEAHSRPFEESEENVLDYMDYVIEIVGNIYDNPELVRRKNKKIKGEINE